jgi:diguanylate cyclase (GGDEF)-like protein
MNDYSNISERKMVIRFFSSIGFIATFLMASTAFINSDYFLAITLTVAAVIFCLAFIGFEKVELAASAILYSLYTLMLYLVLTGGSEGTGPIWIFIVSPVTYSIRGLKRGTIDLILFLLAIIFAFISASVLEIYDYEPTQYPYRIVLSFIIVALLSGYYERSREQHNQKIILLSKKNELLATTDHLTGLVNRRFTMEQLTKFKEQQVKSGETPFIVLADIDNFKKVNDKYGHNIGDDALVHLANILNSQLPNNAIASRWGGEEFLIAIPNTDRDSVLKITNGIHKNLNDMPLITAAGTINITISMGVTALNTEKTINVDIKQADELLYLAKAQGKNRTCTQ